MASRQQSRFAAALLTPATLFLAAFFLVPLLTIALYSFLSPGLYGGVEWSFYHWNYGRMFGWADGIIEIFEPIYLQILGRSVLFAAFTSLTCLIVCYPAAFWVSHLPEKWRLFFLFLITLPFFASLIVRLYAWLLILKPSGFFNTAIVSLGLVSEPIEILYTPAAVVLGMVYIMIPFMFLPLYAAIDNLDHTLVEASFDLGATRTQTFLRIIVPQTLPGIIAGCVIVFIPSVGNFIVPDILGGAKGLMIGNMVEQQFLSARNWPFGSALSVVIMTVVLTVLLVFTAKSRNNGAVHA